MISLASMFRVLGNPGRNDLKLGTPAENINYRLTYFAQLRRGDGFRQFPKTSDSSRAERKAQLRELAIAKHGNPQPKKYRHSSRSAK